MENGTKDPISIIFILAVMIYLFALLIIARSRYAKFLSLMKKAKPNFVEDLHGLFVGDGGKFVSGDGYWFRTPLPINAKTKDPEILNAIRNHDNIIKLFWLSIITVLPAAIIFLNIRGK